MTESVPVKIVSECWQDDKRMNSLFMPFRKKELNPVDWNSKMKFWHNAIENWSLEKNECVISAKKLEKEFKRKERLPLCFTTVFEQMLRNSELKSKDDFLSTPCDQSWTTWAVSSFVKAPMVWSFSKLKDALIETDISEVEYIYLPFLKSRGEDIVSAVKLHRKLLLSVEEIDHLMRETGQAMPSETLELVLRWLQIEKKVAVTLFEHKSLIKFSESDKTPSPVSEADMALFTLKQNKAALIKNLESLEVEKQETIEEAKAYLKKGMRHAAKSSLRKKKELEKCIAKRASALDNTEILLSRIREADSDVKLLDAYKMGLSALKTTFKNAGLTEDSVINTMDEVHEAIDIHDEIQTALSQSVGAVVDDELERELASLMEFKEPPLDLPEVPDVEIEKIVDRVKEMKLAVAE